MDQNMATQAGAKCPCPHHKMVPIYLILLGLLFLLDAFGVIDSSITRVVWPILVMLVGFQKLFEMRCRCCGRM